MVRQMQLKNKKPNKQKDDYMQQGTKVIMRKRM